MAIATTSITTSLLDTVLSSNTNLLQPNVFKVSVNRKKFPNLEFFASGIIHPGLGMNATELPFRRIASVPFAGATLTFGELTIDTILDENLTAYTEVYNWMHYTVNNDEVQPTKASDTQPATYADINVQILNSSNNIIKTLVYRECVPTLLGDISLLSTTGDVQYINCPINFRFTTFEIK